MSDTPRADWLAHVKTEPLDQTELATWFSVSVKRVRALLKSIDGAQKIEGRWRVPVAAMPPSYLISSGLVVPVELPMDDSGRLCPSGDSRPTSALPSGTSLACYSPNATRPSGCESPSTTSTN